MGERLSALLPTIAGQQMIATATRERADPLTPWQGLGVFSVWARARSSSPPRR